MNEPDRLKKLKIHIVWQDYKKFNNEKLGDVSGNVIELRQRLENSDKKANFEVTESITEGNNFIWLKQRLAEREFDLLHVSLHGTGSSIVFSRNEPSVSYDDFSNAICMCNTLKGVVFNVCKSENLAKSVSEERGIPTLGWSNEVVSEKTSSVTSEFYINLFSGRTIEESFRAVKKRYPEAILFGLPEIGEIKEDLQQVISNDDTQGRTKPIDPGITKRRKRWLLPLLIILVLILLAFGFRVLYPFWKTTSGGSGVTNDLTTQGVNTSESEIKIVSPENRGSLPLSGVVVVDAVFQEGAQPWVFVASPGSTHYYPQPGGFPHPDAPDRWEFYVQLGDAGNTGGMAATYSILAMVIDSTAAANMMDWLASQGTENESPPLSRDKLKEFQWGAADSVDVTREQ